MIFVRKGLIYNINLKVTIPPPKVTNKLDIILFFSLL